MSKTKNKNPIAFRKNWDMVWDDSTSYKRSKVKKELEEILEETTGSNIVNVDDAPFWDQYIEDIEESEEEND